MSHLGRPKGVDQSCLWATLQKKLSMFLAQKFYFQRCCWPDAKSKSKNLKPGEILLLENLRFHNEETEGDSGLRRNFQN